MGHSAPCNREGGSGSCPCCMGPSPAFHLGQTEELTPPPQPGAVGLSTYELFPAELWQSWVQHRGPVGHADPRIVLSPDRGLSDVRQARMNHSRAPSGKDPPARAAGAQPGPVGVLLHASWPGLAVADRGCGAKTAALGQPGYCSASAGAGLSLLPSRVESGPQPPRGMGQQPPGGRGVSGSRVSAPAAQLLPPTGHRPWRRDTDAVRADDDKPDEGDRRDDNKDDGRDKEGDNDVPQWPTLHHPTPPTSPLTPPPMTHFTTQPTPKVPTSLWPGQAVPSATPGLSAPPPSSVLGPFTLSPRALLQNLSAELAVQVGASGLRALPGQGLQSWGGGALSSPAAPSPKHRLTSHVLGLCRPWRMR